MPQAQETTGGNSGTSFGRLRAVVAVLYAPAGLLYAIMLLRDAPPEHPQSATVSAAVIGLAIVVCSMWALRMGGIYWMTAVHLWIAGGLGAVAMALAFTGWFVHLREMPWGVIAPTMAGVIAGAIVFRQYAMVLLLAIPALFIGAMLTSGR
ncbi:MAG TPA: hypothetical protein DGT21_04125 [Armatimonadetes bacterium]|jgi:hypothetical protein|nr:hypothetical protein [Armatimonadota bacterium]